MPTRRFWSNNSSSACLPSRHRASPHRQSTRPAQLDRCSGDFGERAVDFIHFFPELVKLGYHAQRAITSNAYVALRHLAMPASTDYWINDSSSDPLLVITGEVDAALTKAMPRLPREVREVVGERRVTIVFDRGGWSPKLFAAMIKDGFDVLTYRKGRCRRINERRFIRRRAKFDERLVDYLLHDQPVRFIKGRLRLRQVTRLCDDGHQTTVSTSRWDLRDKEVAYRMFERWRQENFFKYMREEFLIDALVDYQIEPEDPTQSPTHGAALWTRRSVQPAPIWPSSNANWGPPPRTTPNSAGRPCGASRSPIAGLASSCARPALACAGCSISSATFPSASRCENST